MPKKEQSVKAGTLEAHCDTMLGVEPWLPEFWESLKVPDKVRAALAKLDSWEYEVSAHCASIVHAHKHKRPPPKDAADAIGKIIAEHLLKGNFAAPRVLSAGLLNLLAGKPFKKSGRQEPSKPEYIQVVVAFYELKSHQGLNRPSIAEVRKHLADHGHTFSTDSLSKIFHKLGLAAMAGDARTAGIRKRRKT